MIVGNRRVLADHCALFLVIHEAFVVDVDAISRSPFGSHCRAAAFTKLPAASNTMTVARPSRPDPRASRPASQTRRPARRPQLDASPIFHFADFGHAIDLERRQTWRAAAPTARLQSDETADCSGADATITPARTPFISMRLTAPQSITQLLRH